MAAAVEAAENAAFVGFRQDTLKPTKTKQKPDAEYTVPSGTVARSSS
jgi:hypothetical protein